MQNLDERISEERNNLDNRFYEYEDNIAALLIEYIKDNVDKVGQ